MKQTALLAAGAMALAPACAAQSPAPDDIVVEMVPCKLKRTTQSFYVRSSKTLAFRGSLEVEGERFDIFLPRDKKNAYSIAPRPDRKSVLSSLTSTYLSVDQDRDGKITSLENYYAEFPLRVGDSMFDVKAIAKDGSSITLRPSKSKLLGAALGRKAADFEFKTTDGRVLRRDDFAGKVLVIDCWAPS